jgi:hypothetical protein
MSSRAATKWFQVDPTLDTNAYAADDRLGAIHELDFGRGKQSATLLGISVIDQAGNNAEIDLFFFDGSAAPTNGEVGADNAAFSPTDAKIVDCQGVFKIESTKYADTPNNSIATLKTTDVGGIAVNPQAGKIWVVAVIRGAAATYAADDLRFNYYFAQDSDEAN